MWSETILCWFSFPGLQQGDRRFNPHPERLRHSGCRVEGITEERQQRIHPAQVQTIPR